MKLGTIVKPAAGSGSADMDAHHPLESRGAKLDATKRALLGGFFESPRGRAPRRPRPARFERTNCIQRDTGHMSQIPLRNTLPWSAQDF
jgi:hypothetical protein